MIGEGYIQCLIGLSFLPHLLILPYTILNHVAMPCSLSTTYIAHSGCMLSNKDYYIARKFGRSKVW